MNKALLAAAIAATLGAQTAGAYDIVINGLLMDVEGTSITFTGDTLQIEAPGLLDAGDTGTGDTGTGDTGTGDTGTGDTGTGDTGTGDTGTGGTDDTGTGGTDDTGTGDSEDICANAPENVACGYHVSAEDWASPTTLREVLTIPRSDILSSSFVTSGDSSLAGSFQFAEWAGTKTEAANVWVSTTPGGPAISTRCSKDSTSFVSTLRWSQYDFKYCDLSLNTQYFFNMEHVDDSAGSSTIERFISN